MLVIWNGCCLRFPFNIHFSRGHCSVRACVGQQKKRGKNLLDQLKETDFLQPKPDYLTDDHAWLLRSVTDPTHRESWSQEGQWTVRTERTGWNTSRASIPSPLTLTLQLEQIYLSVCQQEDGSQDCEPRLIIFMVSSQEVKNFGCFCLFPLAPQSFEKMRFHLNLLIVLA